MGSNPSFSQHGLWNDPIVNIVSQWWVPTFTNVMGSNDGFHFHEWDLIWSLWKNAWAVLEPAKAEWKIMALTTLLRWSTHTVIFLYKFLKNWVTNYFSDPLVIAWSTSMFANGVSLPRLIISSNFHFRFEILFCRLYLYVINLANLLAFSSCQVWVNGHWDTRSLFSSVQGHTVYTVRPSLYSAALVL